VVAACVDPNAKVHGAGIERLRAAGIPVTVGVLEREARQLNEAFFHFHSTGLPFVTLKAATTLDGKTATRAGDSKWITGEKARAWVHRLRAQTGAILCGVGTVIADDPLLTARIRAGVPRQPLRIVLDPSLRTPPTSQIARTAGQFPTLIVTSDNPDTRRAQTLESCGLEIVSIPPDNHDQIDLHLLLSEFARREIISVLVEGGGVTHSRFLSSGIADRLLWFVAPKIIGGASAPTSVEGEGVAEMAQAKRFSIRSARRLGGDLLIDAIPESPTQDRMAGGR
jgi:diaminohydroxyphosphoribosylaminopyrimidine deaminase / 5-amino-6-(5-phosphoribosylamino)uracil reductase